MRININLSYLLITGLWSDLVVSDNEIDVNELMTKPLNIMIHADLGGRSHIKYLLEISKVLVQRNHTVIYASSELNRRFSKGYPVSFQSLGELNLFLDIPKILKRDNPHQPEDPLSKAKLILPPLMEQTYTDLYLRLTEVINRTNPDVIVCDFFSPACRDVAEMNQIPLVSGFQSTDMLRIVSSPLITNRQTYGPTYTHELSLLDKFKDKVIEPIRYHYTYYPTILKLNSLRAKLGVPPSYHLLGDFSKTLGLANTFMGLEPTINYPSNIKLIGPILSDLPTNLHDDNHHLTEFLINHSRVLYIAFGSMAIVDHYDLKTILDGIILSLEKGDIDGVIWGLGRTDPNSFPATTTITYQNTTLTREDLITNRHPHLKILPWAPQTTLLHHPHIQLFLSHCGMESAVESISATKPILCMPLLADQFRNARKLESAGIAKYFNRFTLSSTLLVSHIRDLTTDRHPHLTHHLARMKVLVQIGSRQKYQAADLLESYAYTAKICRPLETPVKFNEIACEARPHLPIESQLPFHHRHLLDLQLIALTLLILTLIILTKFIHSLLLLLTHFLTPLRTTKPKRD